MVAARRYVVRGRVQGVGFRYFVQREAARLELSGWVRNLDDGRVEVHAQGPAAVLDELAAALHRGPRFSDVRGVEELEASMLQYDGFRINPSQMNHLKALIREVPDFPKPGINFFDITTLLKDHAGYRDTINGLRDAVQAVPCDVILGIEARGFMFAPTVAYALGKGFVPVRKPGKLPHQTTRVEYALEYGHDTLEMHTDGISAGQRVMIVDDVLATGGTAGAVAKLVENLGGTVAGFAFVIELDFLHGRGKLGSYSISSLIHY